MSTKDATIGPDIHDITVLAGCLHTYRIGRGSKITGCFNLAGYTVNLTVLVGCPRTCRTGRGSRTTGAMIRFWWPSWCRTTGTGSYKGSSDIRHQIWRFYSSYFWDLNRFIFSTYFIVIVMYTLSLERIKIKVQITVCLLITSFWVINTNKMTGAFRSVRWEK